MSDKLNVLFVVPWDQDSGGVTMVAGNVARHLQAEGHSVLFLHPGDRELLRARRTKWRFPGVQMKLRAPFNPDYPVRSVIAFLVALPLTLLQLVGLLRKNAIDVVNVHYPGEQFVYFALCRWLCRVPLVISIHGMDALRWGSRSTAPSNAMALLFRAADLIVAPSWRFLRRCEDVLAPFSALKTAIHNGADVAELERPAYVEADIPEQPFILAVCSLDEWKGVDVLIRAVALLRATACKTAVIVAGEGPQRPQLELLIRDLGLQDQVHLIGQRSRDSIGSLLQRCLLFVAPSRFESFGIAAVEAMACGKAVVATKVDGMQEIIEEWKSGILVEPDDAETLATAIRMLLADPGLRRRLGDAARLRVNSKFRGEQMGENYIRAFRELLAHGV